jgi:hypothetical protein
VAQTAIDVSVRCKLRLSTTHAGPQFKRPSRPLDSPANARTQWGRLGRASSCDRSGMLMGSKPAIFVDTR